MSAGHPKAIAVIPSLAAEPGALRELTAGLLGCGLEPTVVVTGATLDLQLKRSDVPHVSPNANPGFGAAIRYGVERTPDWEWLAIVNDDVTFEPATLRKVLEPILAQDPKGLALWYLDPAPSKPIPTVAGVLAGLSLVGPVLARLRRKGHVAPPDARSHFRPFSFVIVSRGLWDRLGGLDDRLLYTYEDADFARRAGRVGAAICFCEQTSVSHARSTTSGRYLDRVLPVSAWSANAYLQTLGVPRRAARFLCAGALAVRLLLIPVSGAPSGRHARGTVNGIRALGQGIPPALPAYESI